MVLMLMNVKSYMVRFAAAGLLLALGACGGGGDGSGGGVTPPPPPPPQTGIGPAGGTVLGPNGAKVEIPPGALATNTEIKVELSSAGAPALPSGFSAFGQMFAFTPHGTTFAVPVTVTLPFNLASKPAGSTPALYKTNAQNQWEHVATATFKADSLSAKITSFSFEVAVIPPLTAGDPVRVWSFREYRGDALEEVEVATGVQVGGYLEEVFEFGPAFFDSAIFFDGSQLPPDGIASGNLGSSADGVTYWVGTQAPLQDANFADSPQGSKAGLVQYQTYTKNASDASYKFTLSSAFVEVYDGNSVLGRECPLGRNLPALNCDLIKAEVYLDVKAFTQRPNTSENVFFRTAGRASLNGGATVNALNDDRVSWISTAQNEIFSRTPLWTPEHFSFVVDDFRGPEGYVLMQLREPRTYTVDLSSIEVGEKFTVKVDTYASTYNRASISVSGKGTEFETAANAWLRDPLSIGGTTVTTTGLTPIATPLPLVEPVEVPVPPAACVPGPGPDPAAGVMQFSAASYSLAESNTTPTITVTRTGGSVGAVTATFTTSDGSAIGGTDYTPVNATVFFADGDAAPRVVAVPIVQNLSSGEPDKTVNLTLSQPGGCAALGQQTTAVLTIRDDDVPPPPLSFTIGGTVTGLVGTGLVLQNLGTNDLSPGNGAFAFTIPFPNGIPYNVTVAAQPTNPAQVCTVANGSGTVGDANITNVTVTCDTPDATPGLDPLFGGAGKVTTGMPGGATAMAVQTDGKIVLVGGKNLARYHTDGSPDSNFAGGSVTVLMGTAQGVAIQPDGKILVAGFSRTTTQDDFAVERYDANGILDASFSGGSVTTDFNGGVDRAWAVLVQDDGNIVVAGHAAISTPLGPDNDFAVARYDSSGTLDMTFDVDGKVTTNVGGRTDLTSAAVLQPDGGIVLTGRVSDDSVGADVGLVRYEGNGSPDTSFGIQGIVRTNLASLPSDVALQPDGKILVAVRAVVGGTTIFGVVRFEGDDGDVDTGFGTDGLATAGFSTLNDYPAAVVVQSDGKIVVAGQSSNLTNPDFAIARFVDGGTLDGSFDSDGKLTVDFFDSFDGAECAAIQTDGKIVVGGFARNGTSTALGLVRVLP